MCKFAQTFQKFFQFISILMRAFFKHKEYIIKTGSAQTFGLFDTFDICISPIQGSRGVYSYLYIHIDIYLLVYQVFVRITEPLSELTFSELEFSAITLYLLNAYVNSVLLDRREWSWRESQNQVTGLIMYVKQTWCVHVM